MDTKCKQKRNKPKADKQNLYLQTSHFRLVNVKRKASVFISNYFRVDSTFYHLS